MPISEEDDLRVVDPSPEADFVIGVDLAPRLSFATHQADIPVVAALIVRNNSGNAVEGLSLRIRAEPPVFAPKAWTIDRIEAGGETRIRDRRLPLAGGLLDGLTERMRAEITLDLMCGEERLATEVRTVHALARNEWAGIEIAPELLAAFVMPNDPAVARILKEASRALEASGRSGALDGYQQRSRTRVWELVAAVWAAICARRLTYAEPPASFESRGQKVRNPSDIEGQGLATCLDTALLFAGCAEQMGLHPVMVFTKGHAFCGAWLQPQTLSTLTTDDAGELRKAVDQSELVLFETTLATGGTPATFAKAVAEARRRIAEEREAGFLLALDIRQARGRGVHPLPQAGAAPEVNVSAEPGIVTVEAPPELPGFDLGVQDERPPETPAERIDLWKRKLLDLTKRNRLLNLRPSATAIPLFCPDPAALEDRIVEGQRIMIVPPPERRQEGAATDEALRLLQTGDDLSEQIARDALDRDQVVANTDASTLDRGLIELFRKAKADIQEGGSNTLFLALGSLRWRPAGETTRNYRAPLILMPVKLERRSAASKPYLVAHDDDTVFNLTLIELLRQEFDIPLPELAGELPTDASGVDVRAVWNLVRARVRDVPGFEVVEEVTLSTFSFAKYLMWKDLADRTDALKGSPFVRHLIDSPRDPYAGGASFIAPREIDERIDPASLFAPLNADSSQIVAIHASVGDGDFVLEGPPGTGKSETIGNIIAHNLALGRKVLFVSEKMAALEVVHRRLRDRGLGAFCLELHSSKANKRAVLDQLGAAWEGAGEKTAAEWERKAEELRDVRGRLNGLVRALHAPGPAGISPRDAVSRSARWADIHAVTLDWGADLARPDRAPSADAFAKLRDCARRLGMAFSEITDEDRAAFGLVGHQDWSYGWAEKTAESARALLESLTALRRTRADFAQRTGLADHDAIAFTAALGRLARLLPRCASVDIGWALTAEGRERLAAAESALEALRVFQQARASLPTETSTDALMAAPIAAWSDAHSAALSRSWLFRGAALKRLRREMEGSLGWPQSETTEQAIDALSRAAAAARAASAALEAAPASLAARALGSDPVRMAAAIEVATEARATLMALTADGADLVTLRESLRRLLSEGRDLLEPGLPIPHSAAAFRAAFMPFLDAHDRFTAEAGLGGDASLDGVVRAARAIVERKARLNAWCRWVAARREADHAGLGRVAEALESGAVAADDAEAALLTAYCLWAAPLMIDQRPELRGFSSVEHEALIARFRTLDRELSEITADYVRALISQAIPRKDAPNAPVGLGVLSRELQKQKRHKPVRQLVAEMGESLLTLTPCLMMSPLSVAQFLPADQSMVDLVVFDEASQITVPDAIGAIARGRRVIVVGDPKQMPPTSFFDKAAGDDGDDSDTQDLESILDEALAARAPHHRLTGHYRSRHESLIAFSNHAYYDASLVTYPAADTRDSAVSLRRIDGVYAKGKSRTNPIEAQALVAELVRRLRDPNEEGKSIGVVTLNSEQQRLIEDLLDQERRSDPDLERFFSEDAGEPVFVKNLETVQGDQRDVILISIGYGPTEPGARTMSMNFGPLNRQGGERRLNVAITRATTEVVIFASFGPKMIDLSRTSARAVQELKHYLDFAERGPAALGAAVVTTGGLHGYDSDFEMAVAEGLRRRGWDVRTQIGVSKFRVDLGVVHPDAPGRFLAGVECDGATYHSSPSARDRDRVRHIVLEQLGWRLLRLWSTDWFLDARACLDRMDARLTALLEEDRAEAKRRAAAAPVEAVDPTEGKAAASTDPLPEPEVADISLAVIDGQTPVEEPLRIRGAAHAMSAQASHPHMPQSGAAPQPERFYEADYLPVLIRMVEPVIRSESPIMLRRLARLIARRHGFQRTGREIVRVVRDAAERVALISPDPFGEDVVWIDAASVCDQLAYRGDQIGDEPRPWSETPLVEKLGFARDFVASQDPAREMADALGLGRLTGSTRTEFETLVAMVRNA